MDSDENIGTTRWFGRSWGAPINNPLAKIDVPVGAICPECDKPITARNQGIQIPYYHDGITEATAYHRECFMEMLGIRPFVRGDEFYGREE